MKKASLILLVLVCAWGIAGCKVIVNRITPMIPQAPAAAESPPKISNLFISPAQIQAGKTTPISMSFDYEDLNADVDSASAQIELQFSVVSGEFSIGSGPERLPGAVVQDDTQWGRKGKVTLSHMLSVPESSGGTVGVTLTLIDAAGQRSNALTAQINVLPSEDGAGGVGPGGDRCTIIDGNKKPVTLVKIGRQIFFRVVDHDNNFSSDRQDRLFRVAAFQASATGDIEIINWMVETGVNTGVFEGPPGGILLTSRFPVINNGTLSVLDNDTILASYEDPNGVGDACVAIAKVQ